MRAAVLWLVAGCGAQAAGPPRNVAGAAGPGVAIARDQALGWIGIAPRPAREPGDWIPAAAHAVLVPAPVEGLAAGITLSAIDTAGSVTRVTAGGPTKVAYGCDGGQLDVLAFAGGRSRPGAVWLLPPGAPASWRPRPLAIASPVAATESHRRDTVGPITLELERRDAASGTLTIARDGRVLHKAAFERAAMEGADASPLDLRSPGVAIPVPVGAWSIADGGPVLIALQVPSYEGVHLTALLVEADGAREIPTMAAYLYRCAF